MSTDPNAPTVDETADLFAGMKKKKKSSKKADLSALDLDAPVAPPAEEAAPVAEASEPAAPAEDGELDFSDLKKKKKKKVSNRVGIGPGGEWMVIGYDGRGEWRLLCGSACVALSTKLATQAIC